MERSKLVGIGFMGKPDRAARLLKRMMASTHHAYDLSAQVHCFPVVVSGVTPVTGFYLGFTDKGLNLSLFSNSSDPASQKMNHRTTYSMKPKKESLH